MGKIMTGMKREESGEEEKGEKEREKEKMVRRDRWTSCKG